ncbi:multicopper oxidase-domain-containing protein [Ganoderma leucocontextum]|nr:multicopper oxidase-domain-containing protein [Ganoderma leucocontextum]
MPYYDVVLLGSPTASLDRWVGNLNPTAELAVINVEHGKRYCFHVLNIECGPSFYLTIGNHSFTVIEADGQKTKPVNVDELVMYAAKCHAIVLTANQTIGNYCDPREPEQQ